jgi:hypothetical protein
VGLLSGGGPAGRPLPSSSTPDDPSLVVVVEAFDAARADSAVLAEAAGRGVELDAPVLLRHHLVALPDEAAVARAAELLAQDGYALSAPRPEARGLSVYATRTQVVTALSASQERSRMAGPRAAARGRRRRLGRAPTGWSGPVTTGAAQPPAAGSGTSRPPSHRARRTGSRLARPPRKRTG